VASPGPVKSPIDSPPPADTWRPLCLCIDADGVLHRGRNVLPGATRLLEEVEKRGIPYRVVTNNSRQLASECASHYQHLGLAIPADSVFTAADAMAAYIKHVAGDRRPRVYPFGEQSLAKTLHAAGCQVARSKVEYVALGLNRGLTFGSLTRACDYVRGGARLIAANADATVPNEHGAIPGCGAILAAVETATGARATVIGKPAPEMFQLAVRSMAAQLSDALHLGDRLDSDVMGANRAGVRAALVLTGSHGREDITSSEAAPDYIFTDLNEFLAWYFD
jgi:HAD superfamily hydrolase (TIGR01450 family)